MDIKLIREEAHRRSQLLDNLKASLLYLRQEEEKHKDAIRIVEYEKYFLIDQLFNYKILIGLLEQEELENVPKA